MTEKTYRVLCSGGVAEGKNIDDVKARMAALFKTSVAKIGVLFQGKEAVIKKDVDLETAKKYVRAISSTGAVCRIDPPEMPSSETPAEVVAEDVVAEVSEPEETARAEPRVVEIPLMRKGEFKYAPQVIKKVTSVSGGVNFNKMDLPEAWDNVDFEPRFIQGPSGTITSVTSSEYCSILEDENAHWTDNELVMKLLFAEMGKEPLPMPRVWGA